VCQTSKAEHWELPLAHPEIEKLSDPIHYVKNYKSKLYNLVALAKSNSETCNAEAMRLSQNLAYMIAQCTPMSDSKDCTFKAFEKAGEATKRQHFV
jgi:hypothetical protein